MKDLLPDGLALLGLLLPVFLIGRWRGQGILFSVPLGWGLIYLASLFPSDKWEDIEFRQETWPWGGWILMLIWCLLILGVVSLFFPTKTGKHMRLDERWSEWLKGDGELPNDKAD